MIELLLNVSQTSEERRSSNRGRLLPAPFVFLVPRRCQIPAHTALQIEYTQSELEVINRAITSDAECSDEPQREDSDLSNDE